MARVLALQVAQVEAPSTVVVVVTVELARVEGLPDPGKGRSNVGDVFGRNGDRHRWSEDT